MKPRLFIASSVEGLPVAYAIQENLDFDFEVTVWPQGVFEPTKSTLESLLKIVTSFDAAAFVFSADDELLMRSEVVSKIRDNVLFELGLFLGALGREKCFIVMSRQKSGPILPTDLIGVSPITYDAERTDNNLQASLGPASNKIRQTLLPANSTKGSKAAAGGTIQDLLLRGPYRFVFAPGMGRSKRMVFGDDGFIIEGNNHNEHRWRIIKDLVEILNVEGKIFSRFRYVEKAERFENTNDSGSLSLKDQYFYLDDSSK